VEKQKENVATPQVPKSGVAVLDLIQEIEDLGCEFCTPLDPQGVMRALASRLVSRYGVDAAAVWQWNEAEGVLELGVEAGSPALPASLKKAQVARTLLGKAIQDRLPQIYPTKPGGPSDAVARWAEQNKLGFVAVYPLLHDTRVLGVLLLACATPPVESLLALFQLHARLAAVALRDAELFSSTQRTLTKLQFLVDASKALGSTLDLGELLGRILDLAKTQADAERGSIFLVDDKTQEIWSLIAQGLEKQEIRLPLGKGIAGHVAKTGEVVNIPDCYADPRFDPETDKRTGYRTRSMLCLPIRNKAGKIIAALQLLNKLHGTFTDEDVEFLITLSGHMALALENAQLHRDLLEKERLERDLALARGIQRSLLPETTPVVHGFDIAVLNEPCYAVGGDYYDFLSLGQNTLLVIIADVEGKGISSAMIMSNLQATLRALVLHLHSLNDITESLNRMILTDTRGQKYMTMFLGLIDLRRRTIHYINCGHVPPVIVRPGQDPIKLTEGGIVIGLFENAQFERGHVRLQTGDVLILCTDGITEAMDAQQNEYGLEHVIETVGEAVGGNASQIVAAVSTDVARFSRAGTHLDDKVMIAIKAV
jgi:sigma-B regulation protein RsbU (phosphoserine phosphatase)